LRIHFYAFKGFRYTIKKFRAKPLFPVFVPPSRTVNLGLRNRND